MSSRHHMKLVREGPYVAEVDVELVDSETGLASLFNALKTRRSWMKCVKPCYQHSGITHQQKLDHKARS